MVFAQIYSGTILNTIILNDISLLPLFQTNPMTGLVYDEVLQIDTLYPRPGIGWTFDGIIFYPPMPTPEIDPDGDSDGDSGDDSGGE